MNTKWEALDCKAAKHAEQRMGATLIDESVKIKSGKIRQHKADVFRVSSVLNRDVKSYGKKFMFDGCDDTCWNSDQGSPQYIIFEFDQCVTIEEIRIQFQGGFAGKLCRLETSEEKTSVEFYPEDVNVIQVFNVSLNPAKIFKLVFLNSTDFFGRIVIYQLDLLGKKEIT